MKHRIKLFLLSMVAVLTMSAITIPGIYAYLTDATDPMKNNFTIALDTTTTVVEKFPENVPEINGSIASYEKMVQIGNTGYLDCYVRVHVNFTEKYIRDITSFSWDGQNWYRYDDYKDHLPVNWVYNADDDSFYYTNMLIAGDWADFSKNLVYDKTIGEYFYKPDDGTVLNGDIITTPLFRYVKTEFKDVHDMRTYAIDVTEESCPFYLGNNYSEAWQIYDAEEW